MFLKPLVLISVRRTLVPGVLVGYKSLSGWIKTADDASGVGRKHVTYTYETGTSFTAQKKQTD